MKEKIQEWIDKGFPHAEGYDLFIKQQGRRKNLDRTLSKESLASRKAILWHLCNLNDFVDLYEEHAESVGKKVSEPELFGDPAIGKQVQVSDDDRTQQIIDLISYSLNEQHQYKIPYENLPKDLQDKVRLKGDLYNQFDILKGQLNESTDNSSAAADRRENILNEMRQKMDAIISIHQELSDFEKNGPKVAAPQKINTPEGLKLERKNRINNRSKLLKSCENENEKIAEKAKKRYDDNEARIVEIDELLSDALQKSEQA